MNMYLSDDTVVPRYTPPTKGKFWDFGVAAVAASTDDSVWQFPKNSAIIMVIDNTVQAPHGCIMHRLIQKDNDPFSHSIVVVVKDTVRQVTSQGSQEWPQFKTWTSDAGNPASPVGSRCCPGAHRVRISLRTESFFDGMLQDIDVGIVVAAERFSLPMWEDAAEYISNCSVRIVTTRGGGGVGDMDMSMDAVARVFSKAIDTVVNRNDSHDLFTRVGHTPVKGLSVKGKKWEKHEGCPMLWISCHHSVRQFPDQRIRGKGKHKGKDTGKGSEKGKHKGKDTGKAKGKGKHTDQNKDKGKAKGKGKLNDRGGGK